MQKLHAKVLDLILVLWIGLCPDWQDWDPNQGKRNATEAMDLAEKWLDVPQVLLVMSVVLVTSSMLKIYHSTGLLYHQTACVIKLLSC